MFAQRSVGDDDGDSPLSQLPDVVWPDVVAHHDRNRRTNEIQKAPCVGDAIKRKIRNQIRRLVAPGVFVSGRGEETDDDVNVIVALSEFGDYGFGLFKFAHRRRVKPETSSSFEVFHRHFEIVEQSVAPADTAANLAVDERSDV